MPSTVAKKNCKTGYPCGKTCISRNRNCRNPLTGQAKTYAEYLAKNRQTLSKSSTSVAPKSSKTKSTKQSDFPTSLNDLEEVRSLGGSTGAKLVRDKQTGVLYVMKKGNSPEHIREEQVADEAYRALGVPVPKSKIYEGNSPVKLSRYVEGRSLDDVLTNGTEREKAQVIAKLREHCVADAMLANWDVLGTLQDNVIVGNDGIVYRIDNGGSLRSESEEVLLDYNVKPNKPNQTMKRGPIKSGSVVDAAFAYGNQVTYQNVPPHRVFGIYSVSHFNEVQKPFLKNPVTPAKPGFCVPHS